MEKTEDRKYVESRYGVTGKRAEKPSEKDDKEMAIIFEFNNYLTDAHGTIIDPRGMWYKKPPMGLYDHLSGIPAVTRIDWVKYDEKYNRLLSRNVFHPKEKDPFSELLYWKYKDEFMFDCSVQARYYEDDIELNAQGIPVIRKWECKDITLTNFGSNPAARRVKLDIADYDYLMEVNSQNYALRNYFGFAKNELIIRNMQNKPTDEQKPAEAVATEIITDDKVNEEAQIAERKLQEDAERSEIITLTSNLLADRRKKVANRRKKLVSSYLSQNFGIVNAANL